ncbi:MAG: transcriptional regulator NrdR [Gemmatimonadota bacterium]|nr:transcriptional regulator NrdR [Gemmatimonadota bacterium]MDE3005537.1 transcriptional regulator NrdR [Gemmatimonadota bacterium]MDE3012855.1 transcriptional regulator NrdR [Gemmatimonadota bacterium]
MRCPECDATENRVVDTRASRGGRAVRRRRECTVCGARFTTYEYVEERPIQVLKRSGAIEDFDRAKLLRSVKIACAKRPVSAHDMDSLIDDIEDAFSRQAGVEIPSVKLGALVMERLAPLDRVAYVRYASVYRNFQDAGEFQEFVDEMAEADSREEQRRNQVELPI